MTLRKVRKLSKLLCLKIINAVSIPMYVSAWLFSWMFTYISKKKKKKMGFLFVQKNAFWVVQIEQQKIQKNFFFFIKIQPLQEKSKKNIFHIFMRGNFFFLKKMWAYFSSSMSLSSKRFFRIIWTRLIPNAYLVITSLV